ncbi:MAG: hypothetical protein HY707_13605 [Ignavibacteriae bacterium]|nr:hypothetical protein [Ignavibacteriota bacterium]
MHTTTFDETLAAIEKLPPDLQESLIEIIHKRLIESRRREIAKNAAETLKAYKKGKAKQGSLRDLRQSSEPDIFSFSFLILS